MLKEQRPGAARRIVTVAAVLLGIFFMHGMSAPVPGAAARNAAVGADTPSMGELSTTATSSLAFRGAAGAAAVFGELGLIDLVAFAEAQADDGEHVGMYLTGLCLALMTIVLLVGLPAAGRRAWSGPRIGTWWPTLRPSLPVRCRAPDLFALGVLRC